MASLRPTCVRLACALLLLNGTARAEHFDIHLTVEGTGGSAEAFADSSPPAEGRVPRSVFRGRAGEPLTVQFFMTNVKPHEPLEQVTVAYFIVPQGAGSSEKNSTRITPIWQGEFVLDFKYQGRVGLRQSVRIPRPGLYLLRVESRQSHSDHEHFSAIDLKLD